MLRYFNNGSIIRLTFFLNVVEKVMLDIFQGSLMNKTLKEQHLLE